MVGPLKSLESVAGQVLQGALNKPGPVIAHAMHDSDSAAVGRAEVAPLMELGIARVGYGGIVAGLAHNARDLTKPIGGGAVALPVPAVGHSVVLNPQAGLQVVGTHVDATESIDALGRQRINAPVGQSKR